MILSITISPLCIQRMPVTSYWIEDKVTFPGLKVSDLPIPILATGPNASCMQRRGPSVSPVNPVHTPSTQASSRATARLEARQNPHCIVTPSPSHFAAWSMSPLATGWAWSVPASTGAGLPREALPLQKPVCTHQKCVVLRPRGWGGEAGAVGRLRSWTLALVLWLSAEWLRHVPTLLLAPLSFYCWIWSVSWSSLGATQGLELASALIENMQGDSGRARAGPQQGFLPDDVLISGVLDRLSHWWAWHLSLTPTLAAMVC